MHVSERIGALSVFARGGRDSLLIALAVVAIRLIVR